jgi:hypothetical protein
MPNKGLEEQKKDATTVTRFNISRNAIEAASRVAEDRGMSQLEVMSRFVTFMSTVAPKDLQAVALGHISPRLMKMALLDLASQLKD